MLYAVLVLLAAGVGVCLALALRATARHRLLEDLPTSKAAGVFIGLVELLGVAESTRPLRSHLAEIDCVQFAWNVDEQWERWETETYRDSDGKQKTRQVRKSGWTSVDSGSESQPFFLRDDSGAIRIRPDGATIHAVRVFDEECHRTDPLYFAKGPPNGVFHSTGRRRFSETALPVGAELFIIGPARERADVVAPEIAHDPAAELFEICVHGEKSLRGRHFWSSVRWHALALVCAAIGGWLAAGQFLFDPVTVASTAAMVYVLVGLSAGIITVLNGLIGLRQRVRQAVSLIDVQLKRRADLIPRLVEIVQSLAAHEKNVHSTVAALRAEIAATPPGSPGPDPRACSSRLFAISEAYPALTANDAFSRLQRELSETEQRIALARAYFNDIATFYNTRLQSIPDGWIAALARLRPQPLMEAAGWERATVDPPPPRHLTPAPDAGSRGGFP